MLPTKSKSAIPHLRTEIEGKLEREVSDDERSDGGGEGGEEGENVGEGGDDRHAELHEAGTEAERWSHHDCEGRRVACAPGGEGNPASVKP
jgi:hypothetical protein